MFRGNNDFNGFFFVPKKSSNKGANENKVGKFESSRNINKDLKKLAKEFFNNLEWQDDYGFGTPGLSQSRPFGNSSVEYDILKEILEIDPDENAEDGYNDEQTKYASKLYKELLIPYLKKIGESI